MKVRMLKITSNPNNISEVVGYLQELMRELDIDNNRYPDILISLTEAVNNAIIHGNKRDEKKTVKIACKSSENGVAFRVSDEGCGFDPSTIPNPTSPEKLECCGGRGVFIMNALADELCYRDNGRTVEMYFKY